MRIRSLAPEILDGAVAEPGELAASLREVWGVNRYLGGLAALKRHLCPLVRPGPLSLLDVAGGTGDVAVSVAAWAARRGAQVQAVVLDNHPQVLELARQRLWGVAAVQVAAGDARALPFPDCAFDVAVCNLALHHFALDEAAAVIRELDRVSRRGWVVADLERHPLAYWSARALAAAVWRSPITRHDGPLSVQRAFTAPEAADLVRAAGVRAQVHRQMPFRLVIAGGGPS